MNQPTTSSPQESERALLIGVVTTSLALIPTRYAAAISNSVVLLGDLLRSGVECLAIIVSWWVVRRVQHADKIKFQYGFSKLEQISTAFVALAMLTAALIVLSCSIARFLYPQPIVNGMFGLNLALLSVLGNSILWVKYHSLSKSAASAVILSQSRLFRAKTLASLVALFSLFFSVFQFSPFLTLWSDPLGSLFLFGFLFHASLHMLLGSMKDLVDCSIDEALQLSALRVLILNDEFYDGLREIRTRRSGTRQYIELGLEFRGDQPFQRVSENASRIRKALVEALPDTEVSVIPLTRES